MHRFDRKYIDTLTESDNNLMRSYSTHFNVSIYEEKIDFLKILDQDGPLIALFCKYL